MQLFEVTISTRKLQRKMTISLKKNFYSDEDGTSDLNDQKYCYKKVVANFVFFFFLYRFHI